MKKILYIDVDGVLFGMYDGHFQIRPNVTGFLDWCVQHFECRWLTSWGNDRLEAFFKVAHGSHVTRKIQYVDWSEFQEKSKAIDMEEDFYWIEDGIIPEEMIDLQNAGKSERSIYVNPYGRDELDVVKQKLERIVDEAAGDPA